MTMVPEQVKGICKLFFRFVRRQYGGGVRECFKFSQSTLMLRGRMEAASGLPPDQIPEGAGFAEAQDG